MSKAAMNLQDSFLNQVRRENSEVRVLLVNGTLLRGIVKGFDNFTLILNNRNGQHLIYKHAIAQIVTHRPHLKSDDLHMADGSGAVDNEEEAATPFEDQGDDDKMMQEELPAVPQKSEIAKPTKTHTPQTERPARTPSAQNERPPRQNQPQGDRPPRGNSPQSEKTSRINLPQGERPPRPSSPSDKSARPSTAQVADSPARQKPKKEGFNTLDLSSVKLGESK